MKVHLVKKCRKDQGKCRRCQAEIKKGDPYRWIKFAFGPRFVYCQDHYPRPSEMTMSDHLSNLYLAREDVEDCIDEVNGALQYDGMLFVIDNTTTLVEFIADAAEVADNERDSYEESAMNVDEHFPGSSQVDEIQEKANACSEWSDDLSEARDWIEEKAKELQAPGMDITSEDYTETTEIQQEITEQIMTKAREVVDSLEL